MPARFVMMIHRFPFSFRICKQADIVAKVQNELTAHVNALEDKKEIAETVEDIIDFEDYMADANGQPIIITGMLRTLVCISVSVMTAL